MSVANHTYNDRLCVDGIIVLSGSRLTENYWLVKTKYNLGRDELIVTSLLCSKMYITIFV